MRFSVVCAALIAATPSATMAAGQACTSNCVVAGTDRTVSGPYRGVERSFLLHVPSSYDGKKSAALVIDLHGYNLDADNQRRFSGQLEESDNRGFIVAWPQGLSKSWNGYGCCGSSRAKNTDDVGFLRYAISVIKQYSYIDPARVYVTGFSNGALMAHRMGCEAADVVSAVATVSFPLNRAKCNPAKPITVYSIAGQKDQTIYYNGLLNVDNGVDINGVPVSWQSALGSLAAWKGNDGCTSTLTTRTVATGATEQAYLTCRNGVRTALLTIENGGHALYGTITQPTIAQYIWTNVFK